MGKKLRARAWNRVLVTMGCVGVLLSAGALALAQTAPTVPAAPANQVSTLAGDQAIAFHSGYLRQNEPISGSVLRGRDDKQLFSQGDILYLRMGLNADVKMGDLLTLYRPTRQVYHPASREPLGRLIAILGVLEIVKETKEGVAEARVLRAFDSIARGDLVMPFTAPAPVPPQQVTSGPLTGMIVDFKDPRQLTATTDIVYLDRGALDGVALGDRFSVIRPGRRLSPATRNPDEPIGEIKVVGLQPTTATAVVLKSANALNRGDLVNRLPPPPPKPEPEAAPPKDGAENQAAMAAKAAPPAVPAPIPAKSKPLQKEFEDVTFALNKWHLTDQAKKTLTEHADFLKQNPAAAITIEGYADERGSAEYNRSLGEKRAEEVRRFLAGLGLSNTLTVVSYGKDRPICTEPNEPCYAKNRRVHLAVAGN